MKRITLFFALVCMTFAGVQLAAPSEAQALDLQVGIAPRLGAATISDDDTDADANTAFGGGVKAWVAIKFLDFLGAGLNFDYAGSTHTVDIGDVEADSFASAPSVGGIVRIEPASMFAFDVWANYAFGTITTEASGFESEIDATGLHLGVDAFYRIQIGGFKTWVEVGPYFAYGTFDAGDDNGDSNTQYLSYGAVVQGTFEFGL